MAGAQENAGDAGAAAPHAISPGHRRYALILLLAVYALNFLDRQVINILSESIKRDLDLADWQLGMMSGLAFAIFYSVLGIPIARAAEHRHRPRIIAASVIVWSAMTALCGAAQNFVQLCLYRIGVGIGEAGGTPPAHSLITDYTPRHQRASALAFYSMGVPIGSLLGMAMGGIIADHYGWRVAFLVAGAPGIVVGLAVLTLRETRSQVRAHQAAARKDQPPLREVWRLLASKRAFWLVSFGATLKAMISYGCAPFIAPFFLRNHGAEIEQLAAGFGLKSIGFLGLAIGLMAGVCGAISSWLGGVIADRVAAKGVRNIVIVPALSVLVSVPAYVGALLVSDALTALLLLLIPYSLMYFYYGPTYAIAQGIVPPHMRATSSAILLFLMNLIGLGLGPLMVGIVSDTVGDSMGLGSGEGVRWALIVISCFGVLASALFLMARPHLEREMMS